MSRKYRAAFVLLSEITGDDMIGGWFLLYFLKSLGYIPAYRSSVDRPKGEAMIEKEQKAKLEAVAELIAGAKNVVVFTGAGISAESGIPDFRSPGGIWTKFDPDDFTIDKFIKSSATRRKQWELLLMGGIMTDALPNRAHLAIAELERMEKLDCVITQNIDSLHLKAGNTPSRVLEVHGHARTVHCLGCMETFSMEEIIQKNKGIEEDIPVCGRCGGILKPDVVFFGEALPEDVFQQAIYHSIHSDIFIVVGSSLVVHPASMLPQFANDGGARMVIINHAPTPCDAMADIVVHASAGESMACVIEGLRHFFPSAETKGG